MKGDRNMTFRAFATRAKNGARVMITLNINTSDSLVNGSLRMIKDIITENDGKVKAVIIKLDVEKSGAKQRQKYPHIADKYKTRGTSIFRSKIRYQLIGSKKKKLLKDAKMVVFEENLYQFIKFKQEDLTIFCLCVSKGCILVNY